MASSIPNIRIRPKIIKLIGVYEISSRNAFEVKIRLPSFKNGRKRRTMRVRSGIHCAVIMCYVASAGPAKQFRGKSMETKKVFSAHFLSAHCHSIYMSTVEPIQSCLLFFFILFYFKEIRETDLFRVLCLRHFETQA